MMRQERHGPFTGMFLNFPSNFVFSDRARLPAGVIRFNSLKGCPAAVSSIFRVMMSHWFGELTHMKTSGRCLNLGASMTHLFLELAGVLADEAALSKLWQSTGANGTKPCMLCLNVLASRSGLARLDPTGFVNQSCTDVRTIVAQGNDTIWASIDDLRSSTDLSPTARMRSCQLLGC